MTTKTTTKMCTRCQLDKEVSDFYNEDRYHCIECERQLARWRMGSEDNRIRTALKDSKRSAEKFGAYDDLTLDDLRYLFTLSGGRCAYTGKFTNKPSVDHIIPLSQKGANTLANVIIVDDSVNKRKGNIDPSEFMDWHGGFYVTNDIIRLIAARRGEDYETVSREFEEAQSEYNNKLYRKLVREIAE